MITEVPLSFSICVLFCGLIIHLFFKWFYSEKDKLKADHIELLKARLEESRIAIKTVSETQALLNTAQINFHFYGDARTPTVITASNIWRWYCLKNLLVIKKQNEENEEEKLTSVILFVCFDQPVLVNTLSVTSPDSKLPIYEVKEFNNRFAIVTFHDEVPQGTVSLSVTSPS